jgi:hypothetical protein
VSRMHGEHVRDYGRRMLAKVGARELNDALRSSGFEIRESVQVACGCSFREYPHIITDPGMKRFHDGPHWPRRRRKTE